MTRDHFSPRFCIVAALAIACAQQGRVPTRSHPEPTIKLIERGNPAPAGTRLAIQFNDEPPTIQVADGSGGPPILYHGRELSPQEISSIQVLKTKEARDRFADQTLAGAILIKLK